MENADLKFLKKHYGEKFSHLCRELFPTILEKEGLLKDIISSRFAPSHDLYDDIIKVQDEFKAYIYSFVDLEQKAEVTLSPEELFDKAGYVLYPECKTEEDIQKFRKYYRHDEELCTFKGRRLEICRVWFAVKKNVFEIKRENFKYPKRQDEYGTSVISLQFSKGKYSTLSIKNRYNHTVMQADATYGNDLDNIITGLTTAFTKTYGIKLIDADKKKLHLEGYIQANDNMFYKYNFEHFNYYFCPNNIIIYNGNVEKFDKSKFLVFDNYLLDFQKKLAYEYSYPPFRGAPNDAFTKSLGEIKKIEIRNINSKKLIVITPLEGKKIGILLSKNNEILSYSNPNIEIIAESFLSLSPALRKLNFPNVKSIGNYFLYANKTLLELNLPSLQSVGDFFLNQNNTLKSLSFPKLENIASAFMAENDSLESLSLPSVKRIGEGFLSKNNTLQNLEAPSLRLVGKKFLFSNNSVKILSMPALEKVDKYFMYKNTSLLKLNLPKIKLIEEDFLENNRHLDATKSAMSKKLKENYKKSLTTKLREKNLEK